MDLWTLWRKDLAPFRPRVTIPSASRLSRNAQGEELDGDRRATGGTPDEPPDRTACDQGERTRRTDGRPAARPRPGSPDATRAESRSFYFPSAHRRPEPPLRSARSPRMGRRGTVFLSGNHFLRCYYSSPRRTCRVDDVGLSQTSRDSAATSPRDGHSATSLLPKRGFVDAVDKGIGTFGRIRNDGLSFSNELL